MTKQTDVPGNREGEIEPNYAKRPRLDERARAAAEGCEGCSSGSGADAAPEAAEVDPEMQRCPQDCPSGDSGIAVTATGGGSTGEAQLPQPGKPPGDNDEMPELVCGQDGSCAAVPEAPASLAHVDISASNALAAVVGDGHEFSRGVFKSLGTADIAATIPDLDEGDVKG